MSSSHPPELKRGRNQETVEQALGENSYSLFPLEFVRPGRVTVRLRGAALPTREGCSSERRFARIVDLGFAEVKKNVRNYDCSVREFLVRARAKEERC